MFFFFDVVVAVSNFFSFCHTVNILISVLGTLVTPINEEFKLISLMETKIHPVKEYKELFDYFIKRYEF